MNSRKVDHGELMLELQGKHDVIVDLLNGDVQYVDIPLHGNIGDLLIMAGTVEFFEKNAVKVNGIYTYYNFKSKVVRPGEIVVFHGGGNLGDLYMGPQNCRLNNIPKLHGNRVVILPQTIHFRDEREYIRSCEIMNDHPDLHIFLRDSRSYELAKKMTDNIYLIPDMAHQLWPIKPVLKEGGKKGKLGVFRTDAEVGAAKVVDKNIVDKITDWPQFVGRRDLLVKVLDYSLRVLNKLSMDAPFVTAGSRAWIKYASELIDEAVELFSENDLIVTDRLHGHILACLIGIENVIIDNSYGKNASYVSQWTESSNLVKLVRDKK